ncbi:ATP-dependent Lhr-like helicase [Pseudonocardia sediminis]|uniref:ATP-dependent Lhr-like helicase n=1 Tax=Pseudonocardia sediminis TaxID=1397368 RepID=A0A4V2FR50_PSEST|nr:DEAD/DEAH box helicase [Pseudonocardia sediminis]RZT87170.1 ATP-dependent Lhr-like helicase [Pseudonocardia sediminis]
MTIDRLAPGLAHHIVNTLGWRSLRPLQTDAIEPLLRGDDAVLLAPTAGGKTEAAMFPLLSAMEEQRWTGVSVLYICPLKALLNNLLPRLQSYGAWLGRRVELWHGDVTPSARSQILLDRPDVLLTTPESLEAMLVGNRVDHDRFFAGLRTVVVDEVHAFAGDDRGWHLLAVLERLSRVCGRPLQRVGLSATVGNPAELLEWLKGSGRGHRPGTVVAPPAGGASEADIELDYVGSVDNAATVLSSLHRGEKRLVFCDSRALVEKLGSALRERGVTTFLSHASLSVDERRQAEAVFAEARDCVIVSTSTLELGIDVGDLDRVVQINAPHSVASFLQRLGRTGRRPGSVRNCLFLALDQNSLLWAAGLLRLWGTGYVEPVTAPPEPRHIVAQQLLALCLQEGSVGTRLALDAWNGLHPFDRGAEPILTHLLDEGFIDRDGELMGIGPLAEQRYGRRHFMGMTAVFTAPPQFRVFEGRREIGLLDPSLLTDQIEGPRLILLAGRSWRVSWVDWTRQRCFVEADDRGGRARWSTGGLGGAGFALTRSVRQVLLGEDPPVRVTERAEKVLAEQRDTERHTVHPGGTMVVREGSDLRWWTWAGFRTNATLASTLSDLVDGTQRVNDVSIRIRGDVTREVWSSATADAVDRLCLPAIDDRALDGLKFSDALPRRLAVATLAARLADLDGAAAVLGERVRFGNVTS